MVIASNSRAGRARDGSPRLASTSAARGAQLHVEPVALRARCQRCGEDFPVQRFEFSCSRCGSRDVDLTAGEELLLESVTVEQTLDA